MTGDGIRPASEVLLDVEMDPDPTPSTDPTPTPTPNQVLLDVEMDDRLDILVERLRPQSRCNMRGPEP